MIREKIIDRIVNNSEIWDFIIIGGGATGVGAAIDASARGYKTLLLEQSDFGKGTSSRSTKLIHGGVRYLKQGNISLVLEALKERGLLYRNAPHLVRNIPFVVPTYDWWEGTFYGVGLKLYDVLAGKYGFGKSESLSIEETLERIPTLESNGLRGGVIYYDGQFDDSRLLINMVQKASELGADIINYMQVTSLLKNIEMITGVTAKDIESGNTYEFKAKAIINATGVFSDSVRMMDEKKVKSIIAPSQGTHIVLDNSFLPGNNAIMVPYTSDGRVLFAIPWHNRVIVGTTDIEVEKPVLEPTAQEDEIDYLLTTASLYLDKDPSTSDILSVFSGIRPLVQQGNEEDTASISREHTVFISRSGLVTIAGGKWTTYRKMAEDTIDQAIAVADLEFKPTSTEELHIHGYTTEQNKNNHYASYGSDADKVEKLCKKLSLDKILHPNFSIKEGEVIWSIRNEMARTVEDFLARRTRTLFLNAKASIEIAPAIAKLMADELKKDDNWIKEQLNSFNRVAKGFLAK
ncbi:MAG: glycerol-3-phosphate dehydrogenase/oxidase [Ignavibacterium sp.]|nr:MAG: glycerol-3-phosphate dehydrogenase/oxidase [Ignavibacterium sp.]